MDTQIQDRQLVENVIVAIHSYSERMARLVGAYLEQIGFLHRKDRRKNRQHSLPRSYLLELGAILQIGTWEEAGLRPHLTSELPDATELLEQLETSLRQLKKGDNWQSPIDPRLPIDVFVTWMRDCAIHAPQELPADLVLQINEDVSILGEIADFLWRNRHLIEGVQS